MELKLRARRVAFAANHCRRNRRARHIARFVACGRGCLGYRAASLYVTSTVSCRLFSGFPRRFSFCSVVLWNPFSVKSRLFAGLFQNEPAQIARPGGKLNEPVPRIPASTLTRQLNTSRECRPWRSRTQRPLTADTSAARTRKTGAGFPSPTGSSCPRARKNAGERLARDRSASAGGSCA